MKKLSARPTSPESNQINKYKIFLIAYWSDLEPFSIPLYMYLELTHSYITRKRRNYQWPNISERGRTFSRRKNIPIWRLVCRVRTLSRWTCDEHAASTFPRHVPLFFLLFSLSDLHRIGTSILRCGIKSKCMWEGSFAYSRETHAVKKQCKT